MKESLDLGGTVRAMRDPKEDGLSIVRESYPDAHPEGGVGHWTYFSSGEPVAEAWPYRGAWRLRVKTPPVT